MAEESNKSTPYYGWQYDQEQLGAGAAGTTGANLPPASLPPQQPVYPPQVPSGGRVGAQPERSYQEQHLPDMGGSLGYGQGMEYLYANVPQPSQPLPALRQARLQQLREERLRRQQRRVQQPDLSELIQRKVFKRRMGDLAPLPPSSLGNQPGGAAGAGGAQGQAQAQVPLPAPGAQAARSTASAPVAPAAASTTSAPAMQPASEPAQDTAMIRRVQVRNAAFILTGAFVASRVLGLLRSSMFAAVFGTDPTSGAFYQAFLLPDTIFNIVAGGALSSAFIPVFTRYMVSDRDEKTAWHVANTALTLATTIMLIFALIGFIFANQIVPLYNPNVSPSELSLIISLTRIMLFQAVILGSGVIVSAVLNAQQHFTLYALGTVLYNVGLIIGLLPGLVLALLGHRNSLVAVYCASAGVVLGALLQVGIQIPGLPRVGMRFRLSFDWRHPGVLQIGRQMIPRIINAAMLSTTTFVDRALILLLGTLVAAGTLGQQTLLGFITAYYYGFSLMLLPLGIFGMAISTAAFPTIAEYVARGRLERARSIVMETLRGILFLSIPSSLGLIVLALPIIQTLYQHGAFGLESAQITAIPLSMFAIGLAGQAAVEILTRSFYALRDSKTPVIVSVGQFIFKIALGLLLINAFARLWGAAWGMGALALSTSIAGLLEATVLLCLIHQRIGGLITRELGIFLSRVLVATGVMGLAVLLVRLLLDFLLNTTDPTRPMITHGGLIQVLVALVKLLIEMAVGVMVYLRAARLLKIEGQIELLGPVRRLLARFKLSWI
ncbi:murein biosynthesis integral membrane protein MurJ [Thermogemmatispora sp.]|uniref:murein biosynthesis integral membrane protein MurJ n=1 Tax=Thermogemmatispora sp. TaxID=1968838 RepID=UPI001DF58A9F|nr:murein biosynthesis integral membrane protein MurJ [Thermogemmatispora sp.]MBX5448996.1 murein biosynthesis integral membrane protein MurJ [Thermogemmatispora sp.]